MSLDLAITLRLADLSSTAREAERIEVLFASVLDTPVTANDIRYASQRPAHIYRVMVAQLPSGPLSDSIVGFSELEQRSGQTGLALTLHIIVDAAWRNRGIGGTLYDDALAFCTSARVNTLHASVCENGAAGMRFATQRGFVVTHYTAELALDLRTFDERPYAPLLAHVQAQGIAFTTLAAQGNTLEAQRRLYELHTHVSADMPGHIDAERERDTFEAYQSGVCHQPWFQPAGQCVAVDVASGEWVGLCAVEAVQVTSGAVVAYNLDTGVERAYRGRGIAQALKVMGLHYAQAQGAHEIRTNVHPQNAPMLTINRMLGYRAQPGHYQMQKLLPHT